MTRNEKYLSRQAKFHMSVASQYLQIQKAKQQFLYYSSFFLIYGKT